MEDTRANVVAGALSALQRAAIELGAEVIALLEDDGSQGVVTCFWRSLGGYATERRAYHAGLSVAVSGKSVVGGTAAGVLREAISERSQSFLLFPLPGTQKAITGVIGFTEADTPITQVPEAVVENL